MTHDGRAIANFVLDRCDAAGRSVTNLALQKIVYFCHVWSLVELGRPLIRHSFEAWEFGPVLPYLYREFREFDRSPINTRATALNPLSGEQRIADYDLSSEVCDLLKRVIEFYSQLGTGDLVRLSHVRGGPWEEVWNHPGVVNPGMKIKDDSIVRFYSRAFASFTLQ